METDASSPEKKIKDEIREAYAKTYPNCIFSLTNHIERLKAELKALETALAAKDSEILNARREVTEAYVLSLQHILDGVIVLDTPKLVIRIEKTIRGLMEADLSLSPPTGKVLIDIEKLREIEWVSLATRVGVTACPACGGSRDCGGHADAACWLGNILKDTQ